MSAPSIVPSSNRTVYMVEDDLGNLGRVFAETDSDHSDRETTLSDLYGGQYNDPVRVVAFNTDEGWSRDVSQEFAAEIQRRADREHRELAVSLADFVEFYTCAAPPVE
ncbi:hypothetical protein [Bradyrhizobium sp. LHD-71]|uniref:hypothetical protein n=1 Tax=Bradyrhizobium sp. LHD-71 TaxID=3072141 RepID=UPI0028106F17|nr:hypothetical protein [Bradyrhizobium sp. LHD-71]MDQ8726128.1 hypothetical protein [Bradyrhizobium sp. LHD-71]